MNDLPDILIANLLQEEDSYFSICEKDLEMWAKSTLREPYVSAWKKVKDFRKKNKDSKVAIKVDDLKNKILVRIKNKEYVYHRRASQNLVDEEE